MSLVLLVPQKSCFPSLQDWQKQPRNFAIERSSFSTHSPGKTMQSVSKTSSIKVPFTPTCGMSIASSGTNQFGFVHSALKTA